LKNQKEQKDFQFNPFLLFDSLSCVINVGIVAQAISHPIENLIFTLMINALYYLSFNVFL